MDDTNGLSYLFLLVLLALSAFFSASETAFSSLNKIRLKNYADEGNRKAKRALRIAENFDKMLSTILVGNNVVNMASASLATLLATAVFGASGAAIATAAITVLVLIFGEILPKSLAKENSENVAMAFGGLLSMLMKLLTPIVFVFVKIKEFSMRLIHHGKTQPSVTEEELKYIVNSIEQEGVLEEQESDLVRSALEFDEIMVQEILTPRVDLTAINVDTSLQEALKVVLDAHFSRIPVYRGTIDNIIGVLQVRDLLKAVVTGEETRLSHLVTDCIYIHKTMRISKLLTELKSKKMHLAVVTDDYGGTMGIVTMEDVLEQLVGDIWDESDEVVDDLVKTGDDTYLVSGDMNVFSLLEDLEIDDRDFDSDYNTVGGWAMEMLGHIPQPGEQYAYRNLTVTVMVVEEQRIISLRVQKLPSADEETE
ncbi:hemolysin family protein [Marasmitruncus massiliensis]|uniref:hemolysin family protein n=1 Tax=Marasmitruncus massiliensis TaxID=1944642 RepID=UPI000C7CDA28|nr:hemolysin family protein [Marasmitruncus massiliensis]MBE6906175.1 HlyC/CorC family transporter [Oscillospiraceae bacterium]